MVDVEVWGRFHYRLRGPGKCWTSRRWSATLNRGTYCKAPRKTHREQSGMVSFLSLGTLSDI